ncbi:hypothetical protein QN277_018964 [Acacia crassicarpa]|uniref:Uncharacterized protein n=1 Tax=Acacia crassicarpa TaxID=499986 RepID=A0AAE1JSD5_9FABA|nr:hypothetical protein QN277_018964 [Acacia crassicarpa]
MIRRLDTMITEFLQQQLERKGKIIEDYEPTPQIVPSQIFSIVSQSSLINDMRDPTQQIKTKRRPKVASRMKSSIEMSTKQKRTCSYYQGNGHYKTGCSKQKVCVKLMFVFDSSNLMRSL